MMKVKQKIIDTSSMLSVSILQSETETEILLFNNSNFLPTMLTEIKKEAEQKTKLKLFEMPIKERGVE